MTCWPFQTNPPGLDWHCTPAKTLRFMSGFLFDDVSLGLDHYILTGPASQAPGSGARTAVHLPGHLRSSLLWRKLRRRQHRFQHLPYVCCQQRREDFNFQLVAELWVTSRTSTPLFAVRMPATGSAPCPSSIGQLQAPTRPQQMHGLFRTRQIWRRMGA